MKKKMQTFGHGGRALEYGDLEHHIGWLEALAHDEEENIKSIRARQWHDLVEQAIQHLLDAEQM